MSDTPPIAIPTQQICLHAADVQSMSSACVSAAPQVDGRTDPLERITEALVAGWTGGWLPDRGATAWLQLLHTEEGLTKGMDTEGALYLKFILPCLVIMIRRHM